MTQEALKLAEIIEHFDSNDESLPLELLKEISATLRALAQTQEPVQKPVAVVSSCTGVGDKGVRVKWLGGFPQIGDRLYFHPPQRTEQNFCSRCGKRTADLTTIHTCTPPQRTWVGLSDDERDHLAGLHLYAVKGQVEAWIEGVDDFAQAIEAKLKQKNGYAEENT